LSPDGTARCSALGGRIAPDSAALRECHQCTAPSGVAIFSVRDYAAIPAIVDDAVHGHEDYHTARDVTARIDLVGVERVVNFAELIVRRIADRQTL
jgi:hypothetical protein